jgi:bacteriocin-like protein
MPIQYTKLFQLLSEKEISKTELQKIIGMSSTAMAKLSKSGFKRRSHKYLLFSTR